jgi:nitrate reductase alpha subunit
MIYYFIYGATMFNNYKKTTILAVMMAYGNVSAFQMSDLGKPFVAAFKFFKDGQQVKIREKAIFSNLNGTSFCNLSTLALVATVATAIGLGTRAVVMRKNRIKKEKELAKKNAAKEAEELRLAIELSEREKLELAKSAELAQKKALEDKKAAEKKQAEKLLAEQKSKSIVVQKPVNSSELSNEILKAKQYLQVAPKAEQRRTVYVTRNANQRHIQRHAPRARS